MLSDYQVSVISCTTGLLLHIFDPQSFYDLRYNRALNDVGALVMTFPFMSNLPALFAKDNFVEVTRTDPVTGQLEVEETYFTRLTHRFREGNEERYIVGGMSLNHLLARRVIDPADDPAGAGGYSTKAGAADTIMRAFAREQMADLASVDRRFPNLIVDLVPGTGVNTGKRARYDNLLKAFQEMASQGQTDFIIHRTTDNNLVLTILPIGQNKTRSANYPFHPFVQFDPNRGNLSNPSLVIDAKQEQNFCYALGQGQGDTRILSKVPGETLGDSPYNRIEFTEDVRQSDRSNAFYLLTAARASLQENQAARDFTFEPIPEASGTIYNQDWTLGDKITATWDEESVDLRVTDVEINIDDQGESIKAKLERYQYS